MAHALKARKWREAAQIIMDGAALIRKRGFCIGALNDDSGRLCLMGAIKTASDDYPKASKYAAYDLVNRALRRPIHEWNDEQTDSERVAEMLEAVARRANLGAIKRGVCYHGRDLESEVICGECTRND